MTTASHPLHFTKMHGIGNDFMVIHAVDKVIDATSLPVQQLANRHTGIGFDQLLLIEPSSQADFFCRIFNSDGSEAEQCGNGLRCVARYIHEQQLVNKPEFTLETKAGVFPVMIHDYDHICVTMNEPQVQHELTDMQVMLDDGKDVNLTVSVISVGNPHAILKVDIVTDAMINAWGNEISTNQLFERGANVGFMQIMNPGHIRLRTYERGAGETHACGSNACAAAVAGIINGWLHHQVQVEFRLGSLIVEWEGKGKPIKMTGPAARVFDGVL